MLKAFAFCESSFSVVLSEISPTRKTEDHPSGA